MGLAAGALAVWALAGCGEEEPMAAPDSPTARRAASPVPPPGLPLDDALAQVAAEFAAAQPKPDIAQLRREGGGYAMPNVCNVEYPDDIDYGLTLDDTGSNAPAYRASWPARTIRAIDGALLRRDLRILGYPGDLVDAAVVEFSRGGEAPEPGPEIQSAAARDPEWVAYTSELGDSPWGAGTPTGRFLLRLWRYRRDQAPDLVLIRSGGDCGAGEMPIRFDIEPDGGRAFFITAFDLRVCRLSGGDPYDRRRCSRWREVLEGRDTWLSGRYAYAVEWPDGRSRRGELPIEPVYNAAAPEPPSIVLRAVR
jgi:hypothetical protein